MMDTIESQQKNPGILSTVRLKQIHKDRQRRPAEQKRQHGDNPPNSDSRCPPRSEPGYSPEDMEENIHLRNELEEAFVKIMSYPHKNRKSDATEQGTRINVTI
jgi:hypothetical protein